MFNQTDTLVSLLEPYGLEPEESVVYLDLLKNSTSSALEISRRIKMGRTRVYRILDRLIAKELVTQVVDERGFKFSATTPEKLDQLLLAREGEIESLRKGLPGLVEELQRQTGFSNTSSNVKYYSGMKGLERVNFNLLRAKNDVVSFEIETASMFLDKDRAEYLRKRLVEEKIMIRTITNSVKIEPFTKVTELIRNFWEIKHIPKSEFSIKAEMFVYNDVYLVYHYTDADVFCLEIYNQDLADMQKQLFEYLWRRAKVMKKIGEEGEVSI